MEYSTFYRIMSLKKQLGGGWWFQSLNRDTCMWVGKREKDYPLPVGQYFRKRSLAEKMIKRFGLKNVQIVQSKGMLKGPYRTRFVGLIKKNYLKGKMEYVEFKSGSGFYNARIHRTIVGKPFKKKK